MLDLVKDSVRLEENNSFLAKNLRSGIKIHIPMIVSNDLPPKTVNSILIAEQNKIAEQLVNVIDNYGLLLLRNTSSLVKSILKEAQENFDYQLEATLLAGPIAKKAKEVVYGDTPVTYATDKDLKKKFEGRTNTLVQSDYTVIAITGKNIFEKIIGAVTGGKNRYTILLKVYAVYVDSSSIQNLSKTQNNIKKAVAKINSVAGKDSFDIFSLINKKSTNFASLVTKKMFEENKWLNVTRGRKIGIIVAISEYVNQELKYKNINIEDDPSTAMKLAKVNGIYDFIIVNESEETLKIMDQASGTFQTFPLDSIAFKAKKQIKVNLGEYD